MSQKTNSRLEWANSVLGRLSVTPDLTKQIFDLTDDEDFTVIVQFLFQHHSVHPSQGRTKALLNFFKTADASRFSVADWLQALALFIRFNQQNNITTTLEMMTEYMDCATYSQEAKLGPLRFAPLIQYHLETFGFANKR